MGPGHEHERRSEETPGVFRSPAGLALLASVLAAGVHLALIRPLLPFRVASHFGLSGQADGWRSRDGFLVLYAFVIVLMAGLLAAIALVLPRVSNAFINVPHKEHWLAPERRDESLAWLARWMLWIDAATVLYIVVVMQLVVLANTDGSGRLGGVFWLTFGLYLLGVGAGLVVLLRRFARPPADAGAPRRAVAAGGRP
jgi:hypothetical protein